MAYGISVAITIVLVAVVLSPIVALAIKLCRIILREPKDID